MAKFDKHKDLGKLYSLPPEELATSKWDEQEKTSCYLIARTTEPESLP